MATSTIPASNPAGNNQTSPGGMLKPQAAGSSPVPVATQNNFVPVTAGQVLGGGDPGSMGTNFITSGTDHGINALQKQWRDIYGQGTGDSMYTFLSNISGTDSVALRDFITSLMPQQAKAHAGLDASLGASGISPNSSVGALANADLESQLFSTISGEAGQLLTHQEDLTSQMLQNTMQDSADEVASSGWDVFGKVIEGVGGLAASLIPGASAAGGFGKMFSKVF